MKRDPSPPGLPGLAPVVAILLGFAWPAQAQPAVCEVLGGARFCAAVLSCDPLTSFATCTSTGCVCTVACNRDVECPPSQTCSSGACGPAAEPCSRDSDCPNRKVCGSRGVCENAPPPPPCTSDAACDDHDPCNGTETCDGRDCRHNTKPNCDDGNPNTADSCVADDRSQNTYHCVHTGPGACTPTRIQEPSIRFTAPAGGKSGRFVFTGTLQNRFSAEPPHDLPSSTVRVILTDEKGNGLVDGVIKGTPAGSLGKEGWAKEPKGGWSYSNPDPKSPVSRIAFHEPAPKKFGHPFEIEGRLATMPQGTKLRPAGGIIVDWTGDISGPCGVVVVPVCMPKNVMGESWMFCRERALRP